MARHLLPLLIIAGIIAGLALSAQAGPPAPAAAQSVSIVDFAFQPLTRTIAPGDTVTWTNSGANNHTATSNTGVWNSDTITPSLTFSFTFNQVGSFPYHCTFHPSMTGTIVVAEPTATSTNTRTATPSHTPSRTPTKTATATATRTPTRTATATATATQGPQRLPYISVPASPTNTLTPTAPPTATPRLRPSPQPTETATPNLPTDEPKPTATATKTPTLPPPSYNNCQADPNPDAAPDYPVRIVAIDKVAETVTLRNVTTGDTIDLTNWEMCSITGNQHHPIFGTLAPGETRTFDGPAGSIWNNSSQDDGALYNPAGQLVSYWFD